MYGRDCNPAYLFRASDIEFSEQSSPVDDIVSMESEANEGYI